MEGVREAEASDEERANGQVAGKAEEGAVPPLVSNPHPAEEKNGDSHRSGEAVVEKSRDGGKVENGRALTDK